MHQLTNHVDVRWLSATVVFILAVTFGGTVLSSMVKPRTQPNLAAAADRSTVPHSSELEVSQVSQERHPPRFVASKNEERRNRSQRMGAGADAKSANRSQKDDRAAVAKAQTSAANGILTARLTQLVTPFALESDPGTVRTACRNAHGIWSQNAGQTCQLPGGRMMRFNFDGGRLVGIGLSHVGRSPVPLLTAAAVEELNVLNQQADGAWKVSVTSERLSLLRH